MNFKFKSALIAIFTLLLLAPSAIPAQNNKEANAEIPNENIERVILISIDSMGTMLEQTQNENFILTPNIERLKNNGVYYKSASCALPSVTQLNHPVMLSGAYPEKLEFCGNSVYDEKEGVLKIPWRNPELIKGETIFEAMENENPNYTSTIVAGKNYVGRPIWADLQVAPSRISKSVTEKHPNFHIFPEPMPGDVPDTWVMDKALKIIAEEDPEMTLLHLPFLDHQRHYAGPDSLEAWAQLRWTDRQIGRLIKQLENSGKLSSTLIVLTSDHGQVNLWKVANIEKLLAEHGIEGKTPNPEGTFAHLYIQNDEKIEEAASLLRKQDYIKKVWIGNEIDKLHLDTPYTGDILVNYKVPYKYKFSFGPIVVGVGSRGQHGGVQSSHVPIIFFGPNVSRGISFSGENVSLVDIVPTVSDLTGLPLPRTSQGNILPQVKDQTHAAAPEVNYNLPQEKATEVGLIPPLFLILSIVSFIAGVWPNWETVSFNVENIEVKSWVKSSLPLFMSIILALTASLLIHFQVLWTDVPGINPDTYLSWTIGISPLLTLLQIIPLLLIGVWAGHWIIGGSILGGINRVVTGKSYKKFYKFFPFMFVPLILSQFAYTLITMTGMIPSYGMMWLFLVLFWGGFISSLFLGIKLNKKIYGTSWIKGAIPIIIFGILTGIIWIGAITSLLFPTLWPGLSLLPF